MIYLLLESTVCATWLPAGRCGSPHELERRGSRRPRRGRERGPGRRGGRRSCRRPGRSACLVVGRRGAGAAASRRQRGQRVHTYRLPIRQERGLHAYEDGHEGAGEGDGEARARQAPARDAPLALLLHALARALLQQFLRRVYLIALEGRFPFTFTHRFTSYYLNILYIFPQ